MADIVVRVKLRQHPSDASTTDITTRVEKVDCRIGRGGSGHTRFSAGVCTVVATATDDWLSPVGTGAVTAQDVIGQTLQVSGRVREDPIADGRSLFTGKVEEVDWTFDGILARAVIKAVDDLAILARKRVKLSGMPVERTGARLKRVLSEAGLPAHADAKIESGTVDCIIPDYDGVASQALEQISDTEGGWLWCSHGQEHTLASSAAHSRETVQISMSRRAQEAGESELTVVDGTASVTEISPADAIQVTLDTDLLATRVRLNHRVWVTTTTQDDQGMDQTSTSLENRTFEVAADSDVIERYGDYNFERVVLGDQTATETLGTWILGTFGEPVLRVRELQVKAHLESTDSVRRLLKATVGSTANVTQVLPGGAVISTNHLVERVQFEVQPFNMRGGYVSLVYRFGLWPVGSVTEWTLGVTGLGVTSRLVSAPIGPMRLYMNDTPGGRVVWADGDVVTAEKFGAGVPAQIVSRHPDYATLAVQEVDAKTGSCSATADGKLWVRRPDGWRCLAEIER